MWWSKKNKKEIPSDNKKEKEYIFATSEAQCIGDWYRYKIKASSKEEAFKKLVEYFYSVSQKDWESVKSELGDVHYPGLDRFTYEGMPRWFALRISGRVKDPGEDYQLKLEEYAREHNIILRDR